MDTHDPTNPARDKEDLETQLARIRNTVGVPRRPTREVREVKPVAESPLFDCYTESCSRGILHRYAWFWHAATAQAEGRHLFCRSWTCFDAQTLSSAYVICESIKLWSRVCEIRLI